MSQDVLLVAVVWIGLVAYKLAEALEAYFASRRGDEDE